MSVESHAIDIPDQQQALTEDVFRSLYKYKPPPKPSLFKTALKQIKCSASTVTKVVPILKWIPKYKLKSDIVGDMIAGLTVAVMHIPHGLAYAPLAGQPPVVGLYMAVFPTLIYLFLGTSRHLSLGTFAILMMMSGKTVSEQTAPIIDLENGNSTTTVSGYSSMEVGIAVCFLVGILQTAMGLLRLGALWIILSSSLVSGFTAAAAIHVIVYQIRNLLGLQLDRFSGPLKLVYTIIDLCKHVAESNPVTVGLSCCAILVLSTFNELGKPFLQKKFPKFKVPIPMELIVIILGIISSYFLNLNEDFNVAIVKHVPTGLPEPVLPPMDILPSILIDCLIIAIVGVSMNLSLASIFAKRGNYEIDTNQELMAYGVSNIFASFFQCVPSSASLSRSLVQSSIGGKSQIASCFTMGTIVLILLFLGGLFEPVPFAVLSSIVVVTLKGLAWQVKDFPGIWKTSKLDGMVWLATFTSVILLDLDYGLGIGLLFSVLTLILRNQTTTVLKLGRVPDSNLFIDVDSYRGLIVENDVLILKVIGNLHFANTASFQEAILKEYKAFTLTRQISDSLDSKAVVLDFGCVPSIDPSAAQGILSLYKDFKADKTVLYLVDCNENVYNYLDHCKVFKDLPKENIFYDVFSAVEFLSANKGK